MRTDKIENKEVQVVDKIFCDFCGKEFEEIYIEYESFGKMNIIFGFGSNYDSITNDGFNFDICDDCFEKYIKSKLKTNDKND